MSKGTRADRNRVLLLSPCGWGNLGDAAILESVVAALRNWDAGVRITAATLNPADTVVRHGIDAAPISFVSSPQYRIAGAGQHVPAPVKRFVSRSHNLPIVYRFSDALQRATHLLWDEPTRQERALGILREARLVVVAGGGQIDDYWGGPWGQPYALASWTRLARKADVPLVVLSTGVGSVRGPLSRWFFRYVLGRATYVSVRDSGSAELLRALKLFDGPLIVPDLAFGLAPTMASSGASGPLSIGLSPIAVGDERAWPEADSSLYRRHVESIADLAGRLIRQGHRVVFFATDGCDRRAVADCLAEIRAREAARADAVVVAETDTLDRLFAALSTMDAVVASRLHGVLLAHLFGRPVVAISYERKVRQHMQDMRQADFCLDLGASSGSSLERALMALLAERSRLRAEIASTVESNRRAVQAQYRRVFETWLAADRM